MDQGLLKEELDRLYRLYGEQARSFRRSLYVLIVAGLAVFVLLVLPFLGFRDTAARLEAEVARLGEALAQAESMQETARAAAAALGPLSSEARSFSSQWDLGQSLSAEVREGARVAERVAALKDAHRDTTLPSLRDWIESDDLVPPDRLMWGRAPHPLPPFESCVYYGGLRHAICRMCAEFRGRQAEWQRQAEPFRRLDAARYQQWGAALAAEVEAVCTFPEGDADDANAQQEAFLELLWAATERVAVDSAALRGEAGAARRDAADAVAALEGARTAASERLVVMQANIDRISGFNRIGTPVGDLPIGLGQLVLMFPVVVALAFAVVATGYQQMAATQRAFRRLCAKRDRAGAVIDAAHLRVIAPLWLDRSEAPVSRALHWAVIAAPAALVAVNLWMIARTGALTALLPDDTAIPAPVFLSLYAFAVAILAGGLWQIAGAARRADAPDRDADPEAGGDD